MIIIENDSKETLFFISLRYLHFYSGCEVRLG